MQAYFAIDPSLEPRGFQDLVEFSMLVLANSKTPQRFFHFCRLSPPMALRTDPFKKDIGKWRVRLQVMTFTTHQETIGRSIAASKRAGDDMTSLKRNFLPATEYGFPTRIRRFDVVLGAVVKTAGPAARFSPIDEDANIPEAVLPIGEYFRPGRTHIDVGHPLLPLNRSRRL